MRVRDNALKRWGEVICGAEYMNVTVDFDFLLDINYYEWRRGGTSGGAEYMIVTVDFDFLLNVNFYERGRGGNFGRC